MKNRFADLALILALLIAVLSSSFSLQENMEKVVMIVLMFLGLVVALCNVDEDERLPIIFGGTGILIAGNYLLPVLEGMVLLESFSGIIRYLSVFVASIVVAVGLIILLEKGTHRHKYVYGADSVGLWDALVGVAVAFSLVLFVLVQFFDVSNFTKVILVIDIIVSVIFVVDLVYLYRKSEGFFDFIKEHVFDIVAAIPFSLILPFSVASSFSILKLGRAVKIVRLSRVFKLAQTTKFAKYFSKHSGYLKLK